MMVVEQVGVQGCLAYLPGKSVTAKGPQQMMEPSLSAGCIPSTAS